MSDTILKQRTPEWRQLRCGDVTASRFRDIMTRPKTKAAQNSGEWSETAKRYMEEKLAELTTCVPNRGFTSTQTDWGIEHEQKAFPLAKERLEQEYGTQVFLPEGDLAYFHHPAEPMIGCSPDGAIGDDGLLEIKCPYNAAISIRTRLEGFMPENHVDQVQGSLWITGRKWYGFVSFDPRLAASGMDPLFVHRVERDDDYILTELAPRVLAFRNEMLLVYKKLVPAAPF